MAVAAMGVGAAGGANSSAAPAPYQLGVVATLSGGYSYIGDNAVAAAKGYFDAVNASGGINGAQVNLNILDDQTSATQYATDARQLVTTDNVSAILGNDLTFFCPLGIQYGETVNVPVMCGASSPQYFVPSTPDAFSSAGIDVNDWVSPEMKIAQSLVGAKKPTVAVVVLNDPGDVTWGAKTVAAAKALGWRVLPTVTMPLTTADTSPYARKLAPSKPSLVFIQVGGNLNATFIPTLRANGDNPIVIGSPNSGGYKYFAQIADPNFYQMSYGPVINPKATNNTPAVKAYIAALASQGQKSVADLNDSLTLPMYVSDVAVGDALKACGDPCSGSQLASKLASVHPSIAGLMYSWYMTPSLHVGPREYSAYHWDAKTKVGVSIKSIYPAGSV
jgi:ABC-type branched-subunit amino acid transport system substrate-binding protein